MGNYEGREFTWRRVLGRTLAHQVDQLGNPRCRVGHSQNWTAEDLRAKRCRTCLDMADGKPWPAPRPPSPRPIGEERMEFLRAMYYSDGYGGVKGTVIDKDTKSWLLRHNLASTASHLSSNGTTVRWRLTSNGRAALDKGTY